MIKRIRGKTQFTKHNYTHPQLQISSAQPKKTLLPHFYISIKIEKPSLGL